MLSRLFKASLISALLSVLLMVNPLIITSQTPPALPDTIEVFRFYSDKFRQHFFTAKVSERDKLINNDSNWKYEGLAFNAYPANDCTDPRLKPIYRLYNSSLTAHLFTTKTSESNKLVATQQWKLEGIAFCGLDEPETTADLSVARFYNSKTRRHFLAIKPTEINKLKFNEPNWDFERIEFLASADGVYPVPSQVGTQCPITTASCVPCLPGTTACRTAAGETIGFKGWACQNNNPGNIRYSSYRNSVIVAGGGTGACGERGGYSIFKNPSEGFNALKAYLKAISEGYHSAYPNGGNYTLIQFFSIYAPSSDNNNPNAYATAVGNALSVNPNTMKLGTLVDNRLADLANAIKTHEGWFVN